MDKLLHYMIVLNKLDNWSQEIKLWLWSWRYAKSTCYKDLICKIYMLQGLREITILHVKELVQYVKSGNEIEIC